LNKSLPKSVLLLDCIDTPFYQLETAAKLFSGLRRSTEKIMIARINLCGTKKNVFIQMMTWHVVVLLRTQEKWIPVCLEITYIPQNR